MLRTLYFLTAALCTVITAAETAAPAADKPSSANVLTLYVSCAGNDTWSGRYPSPENGGADGPFKTITRARDAIRVMKKTSGGLSQPVTVQLDSGTYYQQEPLEFTHEDSGSRNSPITYRSAPGAAPVISGGTPLQGWEPDTGEQSRTRCSGKLWRLRLPPPPAESAWNFNQLYINGELRTRARTPNRGQFFRTDGPTGENRNREFFYSGNDLSPRWRNQRQILLVVYHSWETSLHHIHSIDSEAGVVTLREAAPWPLGQWEKNQRYYAEGVFEELDQPGEWYLDGSENMLYYYPLPDETPESVNAVAPLLRSTLISFNGQPSKNQTVDHIRFQGISFRHTDANLKIIRNPGQGEIYQPALIMATGLRNALFENCEISCAGAHAIWLAAGCSETIVRQCHLHSLGGGGVYIGGGWGVGENAPTGSNTVDNCYIHNAGNLFHGAHGVWIGKSSSNKITHNEISNLDYSGISCGWSWGFQPTSANHNTIDFNHIHHLSNGEGLSDMGGIYTLGISPGTTLRNNHIHDVYSYEYVSHGSGLYPDEGSSDILMENNVVYRVRTSPLFMHYGAECTVRNNILALGGHGQLRRSREDKRCHYSATQNIVYSEHPQMLDGPWKNKDWHLESNLYWNTTGESLFAGRSFVEWQAEGNDKGSIVADPLFKDPDAGDFSLKPESPAGKTGFKPIDLSRTGLYGQPEWVALPNKYPDRKLVEIAPPEFTPIAINYTFESLAPKATPFDCQVLTSGAATVTVSDETAAEGRHSLKFRDTPGLSQSWMPHILYERRYTNGLIRLSWDMLNSKELPADFQVELREYPNSSYLTGLAVSISKDGTVKASGQTVGVIPSGVWTHADIQIALGKSNKGTYRFELTIPGKESIVKELPIQNPKFKNITWLGITSNSKEDAIFFIDNLRMGTSEELANPPKRRQSRATLIYFRDNNSRRKSLLT